MPVAVELPDVPADHVIAASFSSTSVSAPFSFRLDCGSARFETARFGKATRRRERCRGEGAVIPVDYFLTQQDLARPVLRLHCRARRPGDYLVAVSVRPRVVEPPPSAPGTVAPVPATRLSQTTLARGVREQACSPVATAMALGISDQDDCAAFVATARHRPTGLYGVWPQNLWAAARHGRPGAVELVCDWNLVVQALASGGAVVASTRFAAGQLDGSPLAATPGHLVLVRGLAAGTVHVHDPAAPPDSVERRYDAVQFAAAWMRHRGAAYVFASPT